MYSFVLFLCFMGSYLLFTNGKKSTGGNHFLATLFLLSGIQFLSNVKILEEIEIHIAAIFFINTLSTSFLIGPTFYFYVVSLINPEFKLKRIHLVHLIPFLLILINTSPYILSSFSSKIQFINDIRANPAHILDVPQLLGKSRIYYFTSPFIIMFYLFLTARFFQKNKYLLKNHYSTFQTNILERWIQILLIFSGIIYIASFIFTVNNYLTGSINGLFIINQISAISLMIICFQLFTNPYILFGFTEVKYFSNRSLIARLYLVKDKTVYSQKKKDDICEHFEQLEMNKSYLEQGYTLRLLKKELGLSNKSINYYFNNIAKISFSEWKNKKRAEHALKLIDEGFLRKYTREQLAKECGFLSRSNFNQALKNYTPK